MTKEQFYSNLLAEFEMLKKQWETVTKTYTKNIDALIVELKEREKDIFKDYDLVMMADVSLEILETIQTANKLIDKNNNITLTLSKDQESARQELRYAEVAKFLSHIDYVNQLINIAALAKETEDKKKSFDAICHQIEELTREQSILETQSKDESIGAKLVNQHLSHFFGHNELKLVAEGNSPNIRFKILRNEEYANNLSEGECSLISFCYFIAKMEDELKDKTKSDKLIIYIDDPIANLDKDNISLMFSFIESVIAKPKKYCQLFIATHNLDFLKYLQQLTFSTYETVDNKTEKPDLKHFLIEREKQATTVLKSVLF